MWPKIRERIYKFLHWLGKYTKTDMVYLAHGGFWLTLRHIVSAGANFFLAIAFANLLSKETYGTYTYILSSFGLLSAITISGMSTAVDQSVARGYGATLIRGYAIKLKTNLVASAVALAVAAYYLIHDNPAFAIAYAAFAIIFPFWDASSLYDDFLRGKTRFKTLAKWDIVQKIALTAALLGVIFLRAGILALILASILVQASLSIFYYRRLAHALPADATEDPEAFKYAKHLSVINVVGIVANQIDSIALFRLIGPVQLAIYSFAIAAPEQIKGVLTNLGTLAFPRFAQRDFEVAKQGLKRRFPILFLMGITIVGAYILAAPLVYKTFFPKYTESIFYSQLFALSMLNMTFGPTAAVLQAHRKVKEQYISNIIGPLLRIIASVLFIYWWGVLGLVIARVIARYFGSLLDLFLLYRKR